MVNSSAMIYARRAGNEIPRWGTITGDPERALRDLADAIEDLVRAVAELAKRQG